MPERIAYLPIDTHPETAADGAILAALRLATALGCRTRVSTFAIGIPPVASPVNGFLINIEGMARAAEERSAAECARLQGLLAGAAPADKPASTVMRRVEMGGVADAAATEARYFDMTLLPWSPDSLQSHDLAQALVFGTGLPVILVPPQAQPGPMDHVAVAWDESRVAARALGDALALLAPGGKVTVLTVRDEKALRGEGLAQGLAKTLQDRGYRAEAVDLNLAGRPIAAALQEGAIAAGAQMLAMGGFGHSRLRDFVLGGATKGILADLRLPVLLAH